MWNCRWLIEDNTADQRRPDFSHCVMNTMPDFVTMRDDITGKRQEIPVTQIWIDPRHRDAWKAAEIMAYVERRGREGFGAIMRYNETDATVVFPPTLTGHDAWLVREDLAARGKPRPGQNRRGFGPRSAGRELWSRRAAAGAEALGKLFAGDKP